MGRLYWVGLFVASALFLLMRKRIRPIPQGISKQIPPQELPINQFHASPYWLNLKHYIAAQTMHETGGYTSRLALEQKNITGMNVPSQRNFVGYKDSGRYMRYDSFFQSIQDLLLWMSYTKFPQSVPNSKVYVQELKKRGYFGDSEANYLRGVNSALRKLPYSPIVKIVD
jgi:hypothetical protein